MLFIVQESKYIDHMLTNMARKFPQQGGTATPAARGSSALGKGPKAPQELGRDVVLVVEGSVARRAQEWLLEHRATLVMNVKEKMLHRLSQCTGATVSLPAPCYQSPRKGRTRPCCRRPCFG